MYTATSLHKFGPETHDHTKVAAAAGAEICSVVTRDADAEDRSTTPRTRMQFVLVHTHTIDKGFDELGVLTVNGCTVCTTQ